MKKKQKAVLITGGTKRLGLVFTKQSLAMGYTVIAHFRTNASPLKRWLKNNIEYKNNIYFIQYDLQNNPEDLIDGILDFPVETVGLINNAAVFTEGNLHDTGHYKESLRINTEAPLFLSNRFCEKMGKGWIINITDANIASVNRKYQNYRISKIFLSELTRQQAFLYGPSVRVNAIAPGLLFNSNAKEKSYFADVKKRVPLKKGAAIDSIKKAYSFLVENRDITGQIIYIDGGFHLCR